MNAMPISTGPGSAVVPSPEAWIDGEPVQTFADPREVLAADLPHEEKRALLAHWASDASSVESAPALRRCPGLPGRAVPVDDVLAALRALDKADRVAPAQSVRPSGRGRRVLWTAGRAASPWRWPDARLAGGRRPPAWETRHAPTGYLS